MYQQEPKPMSVERPDQELMMDYKNTRSPDAMVELFRRYRRPIFHYLLRRTGSPVRSEDLVQEVFANLMSSAPRYQPTGSFKAYLYRIAANLSAKEWRKVQRRVPLNHEPVEAGPGAEGQVVEKESATALRAALLDLEPDQRDAIVLREYEGLSYAEIADVLAIPAGTVKSRIARGKLALRQALVQAASA